jgi:trimeric autotransporter adhesin
VEGKITRKLLRLFFKNSLGAVAIPSELLRAGGDQERVGLKKGKGQRLESPKWFPSHNSTHNRPQRLELNGWELFCQLPASDTSSPVNSEEDQMQDQMKGREFGTHTLGIARIGEILLVLLVGLVAVGTASAQVRNSTITGTVTDQSGAVVPRAMVTVTNQLTNEAVKTQSGAAGDYSIPYLPAGRYALSVDAPGFRTYRENDIEVATGVTVQVNVKLAVGATSQLVEVQASTAQLQTESSSVTGSIETQVIKNVPNINNDPLYYATLQAGVVPAPGLYNDENLGVGYEDRIGYSEIRVNGGEIGLDDIQLDGVPVQDSGWHSISVMPNRDALQEVTVAANDLSADLGGGQAIIQMVTKSGTNTFHGDAYYNLRNEILNANTFSNDLEGLPRQKYRVGEAGGSIGGPVIIPRLFTGKDKVFFFASFDRLWNTEPASGLLTVPTDLQRQGDYGETLINSNGTPAPAAIYNPFSVTALGNGVFERAPYPASTNCSSYGCGSIVTNPDQYGLKYLQAFPEPNHTPSDAYGDNNYYYSGTAPTTRNNFASRLDFHFGRNSFYLSGGIQDGTGSGVNAWGPKSPWLSLSQADVSDNDPYVAIGDIITLNSTTFIDLHAGYQRIASINSYPTNGGFTSADYAAYGMPAAEQSLIVIPGVAPSVYSLGYGAPYSQTLNNTQWNWKNEHQNNYDFNGSITKVIGRWTLKEGADQRIDQGNWRDTEWATPSLGAYSTECYCEQYYTENGNADGALNTAPQQSGTPYAQGAIGVMGYRLDPGSGVIPALSFKWFSLYTQNDWKATSRLTFNVGLRYEIQPGPTERHNREYSVDLYGENPFATGLVAANPQAGLGIFAFAGLSGNSRNLWNTEYSDFAPRVGAAFRLTDRTVLRGGYGRIYAPSNSGFNANGTVYGGGAWSGGSEATPYGLNYNGKPGGVGDTGNGRFEDQADSTLLLAPGPVQSPWLYGEENGNAGSDFFIRNMKNSYVDQWNVFVERRIGSWLASAGYVGSKGFRLPWRLYPLNGEFQIPQTTLQAWRSQWVSSNGQNDPSQVQVTNPMPALVGYATGPMGGTTISAMQSQEAYLGLLQQTVINDVGSSLYNSLEISLKHSYSSGLTAQFSYDYSHVTGISGGSLNQTYAESQAVSGNTASAGGFNYADLQSNKGILGFDVPHRFVGVVTYLTQWGSGQKYELGSPIARALAGGWQLGTVVTVQEGEPWGPSCSTGSNIGSIDGKCIETGQPLELPKSLQHWYGNNPAPVTLPDGHTFTPGSYSYLKWNPDAFTNQIVQFPNGNYSLDQYWYGNTPTYMTQLRLPAFQNVNLNITRQIPVTERYKFELLGEFTNFFNHPNFLPGAVSNGVSSITSTSSLPPGAAIGENGSSGFGSMSPDMLDPRQITLTARFTF